MRRRVLIVDDHAIIRLLVRSLFEAQDLDVSEASDGVEGVRKAQTENPALVILDLSMPVMNGLEAARALKRLRPEIPLLMFTNNDGGLVEAEARSVGIAAVVSKSDADSTQRLLMRATALLDGHRNFLSKAAHDAAAD
ncbi:MAG: response regulator [Terriglobales bacterium]